MLRDPVFQFHDEALNFLFVNLFRNSLLFRLQKCILQILNQNKAENIMKSEASKKKYSNLSQLDLVVHMYFLLTKKKQSKFSPNNL